MTKKNDDKKSDLPETGHGFAPQTQTIRTPENREAILRAVARGGSWEHARFVRPDVVVIQLTCKTRCPGPGSSGCVRDL